MLFRHGFAYDCLSIKRSLCDALTYTLMVSRSTSRWFSIVIDIDSFRIVGENSIKNHEEWLIRISNKTSKLSLCESARKLYEVLLFVIQRRLFQIQKIWRRLDNVRKKFRIPLFITLKHLSRKAVCNSNGLLIGHDLPPSTSQKKNKSRR